MTKKIIISVVSVLILSIVGCFIGINWNSIKTLLSGSKIYTYEQIQDSYDKGYKDANTNETNYLEQLDYYRNLVEDNELEILNLKNTVNILERTNENNTQTIADLETQKQTLEIDVENLQLIKTENEETITNLNLQISSLRTRVVELTADKTANQNEIVSLKNQILNLQTLNTQLQRTNELNAETITSLNNQIANLNSQISEMNTQVSNNSSVVNTLNNRITELEKTVSYYEQYIANLENGEQVVATFEFDGSVYNIQIVNKNDYAGVVTPTSTDYVKFNYWVVNGEQVDLTTYALTTNTTFVANVSYYYDVKFMIDTEVFNSQIVEKDTFAVLPEAPTKDGYVFDGWTSNGIDIVDTTSTAITQNIIFTAKFTKVHNVTFIYEDSTLEIQQVKNGQYAQTVSVENTNYKKFNGWLLNGAIVDLTSYKITADTVLTANITYSYDVTFIVDGIIYSTQIIEAGMYATVPISPKKDDLSFKGWSLNGSDIIKIINYPIYENTTYIAVFGVKSFESVAFSGANFFSPVYIWTDGENAYYSEGTKQFVLNKETFTWESKTWNITDSNFSGSKVWTYKGNVYYSSYVLDKETSTWVAANWNGYIPSGIYIWTDGEDYFYSNWSTHYMLKQETNTWEKITFTGLTNFYGDYIWTDGENAYYSRSSDQYVLNKSTLTWSKKTWSGLTSFSADSIWTDGENFYYSIDTRQYVLNKSTSTWVVKTWNFPYVDDIWTDGENIYCSDITSGNHYRLDKENDVWEIVKIKGLNNILAKNIFVTNDIILFFMQGQNSSIFYEYILNKEDLSFEFISKSTFTSTSSIWTDGENIFSGYTKKFNKELLVWEDITFSGLTSFNGGNCVWTDGENIYYSYTSNQYILDKEILTWSKKTWSGLTSFVGYRVWTDGENIYYSESTKQYILNKETSTWEEMVWFGLTSFSADYIWTDGENIYFSSGTNQYILDKETSTWVVEEWSILSSFFGYDIWTDGENVYYSNSKINYVLK